MYPLLVFASGVIAGAVGIRVLKRATLPEGVKAAAGSGRAGLDRAQEAVREAALSGLSAVERTSATLRTRLTPSPGAPEAAEPDAAEPDAAPADEAPPAPPAAAGAP